MAANRRCKEKFHAAIYSLAAGEGDVRSRLRRAHRHLKMLSEEEVPPNLRGEWLAILRALTRYGPEVGSNGEVYRRAVDHTMSRIKNSTGRAIAEKIWTLVRKID
jgi:hypothetical protein